MTKSKIQAIYALYPQVKSTRNDKAYDINENEVIYDNELVSAKAIELKKIIAAEQAEAQRRAAYIAESDPLFFKWQRGEATEQEWKDKVAEIKQRYPK